MIKVLVVDDSALVRKFFGRVFEQEADLEVQFARNGVEALEQLPSFRPDVVTLDVNMPQMNGLECLDRLMLEQPCAVVMVSTATAHGADTTLEALRLGAVDFVTKPEGTVSLHIDAFGPQLVAKVRSAATAKVRSSLRLRDRVRHRTGAVHAQGAPRVTAPPARRARRAARPVGDGLVLVGSSTGGPPALEALLAPLPAQFPWPMLVAQHMPASFTDALAKRLDALCHVSVEEVCAPTPLEPGCVYIGRGDADLIVTRRGERLFATSAPADPAYPWHPSATRLVESAMEHVPPGQLVGVLMTGMGSDGAAALAKLREQGGTTIAEAEETAVVWGMPGELVRAGGASWIEPLPDIAARLRTVVPRHAART